MIRESLKKFLEYQKFLFEYQYKRIDNYLAYVEINSHKTWSLASANIGDQSYFVIRWESE